MFGFEALQLDFFDNCGHIWLFRLQINLVDGSVDNGLSLFGSRLLPRSERPFRRKTESRSVRLYFSIHRYIADGCLRNALAIC